MSNREDYVGDKNPTVLLYAMDNNLLPQSTWQEPIPSLDSIGDLADNAFANPYSRTYPCHTKAACMMSAVWDASKGATHPLVSANIRKHASAQGISEEVDNIYKHFEESFDKQAAATPPEPERQYALQIVDPATNEPDGYFDITYPHSVLSAAEEADTAYQRGQLGDPLMAKVANAIVKAATAFTLPVAELPITVQTFGTQRLPDPYRGQVIIASFAKKAGVKNIDDYTDTMLALQEMAKAASTPMDMVYAGQAAANHIYQLNNANGIYPTDLQETPHALVFGGPTIEDFQKEAASCVPIANVPVPAYAITALPDGVVLANFSKAAAATILAAKQGLEGQPSIEKSSAASDLLASLTPEATSNLLRILSEN